jgi:DNA-binding XRE family transcriptional regulator
MSGDTPRRLASDKIMLTIGQRLRWIREAYEAREPLQHSQQQWAQALGIPPSTLSRWENGKQIPQLNVLLDLVYLSGATMDYVFFGTLSRAMLPWLRDALLHAHPGRLVLEGEFVSRRDSTIRTSVLRQGRTRTRSARRRPPEPPC